MCVDRETGRIVHDILVFEIDEAAVLLPAQQLRLADAGRSRRAASTSTSAPTARPAWTRHRQDAVDAAGPAVQSPSRSGLVADRARQSAGRGLRRLRLAVSSWRSTRRPARRSGGATATSTTAPTTATSRKRYGTAKVIDVDGKPQLVYPSAGATIAYEPQTGEEIWRVRHGGMNACAPPLFADGRLYLNTASGGFKLFAMRVGGTRRRDQHERRVEVRAKGVPTRSSPLLVGDLIFMVSDAGIASCLDAKTGKPMWQQAARRASSPRRPCMPTAGSISRNQDGATFVVVGRPKFRAAGHQQAGRRLHGLAGRLRQGDLSAHQDAPVSDRAVTSQTADGYGLDAPAHAVIVGVAEIDAAAGRETDAVRTIDLGRQRRRFVRRRSRAPWDRRRRS